MELGLEQARQCGANVETPVTFFLRSKSNLRCSASSASVGIAGKWMKPQTSGLLPSASEQGGADDVRLIYKQLSGARLLQDDTDQPAKTQACRRVGWVPAGTTA